VCVRRGAAGAYQGDQVALQEWAGTTVARAEPRCERLRQVFRVSPGNLILRKSSRPATRTSRPISDAVDPILRELTPEKLATVQDDVVDSCGRPLLRDKRAEPAGWVSARDLPRTPWDDNENNTLAAKLLWKMAEVG